MENVVTGKLGDLDVKVWLTGSIDLDTKEQFVDVQVWIQNPDGTDCHEGFPLVWRKPISHPQPNT